jgi:glycosyltransferase involved in cell wall biosynthesis
MHSQPPILVFSDDWGRHPSSCQHLISHVTSHRHVVWINTIGTRLPRWDWQTAKRIVEKTKQWLSVSGGHDRPIVLSPFMWPSFRSRFARSSNRRLLLRAIKPILKTLPEPPIVVTTLPVVTDLVGAFPAKRWVYYCVDDYSQWPGYDGTTLASLERELIPKVDDVIAVSDTLVTHIGRIGKSAKLLTHGVDLEHWRSSSDANTPPELTGLVQPFIVFWGVIDRRMDLEFVRHLSTSLSTGTIVLFGPQDHPDPELFQLPRVAVRPALPFARLPGVAAAADCLIMPYADLPVTRAIQPLKLKEYLATGKPAVVRDLPATREWADACDVCDSAEEFTAAVQRAIKNGLPESQKIARQRLADESWAAKAKQFEMWIDGIRT